MTPETTFLVGALCANFVICVSLGLAFRHIHARQGREDLAEELFRKYRDDPNEVSEWVCRGAIIQLRSECRPEDEPEIRELRRRLLAPQFSK